MAAPVITSIAPTGGSSDGGTTVTIVGTDLGTPTAVAFGANPATSFAGESATRAYAVAPAGTGTVNVTLTTAGGTSAAATYTYGSALFSVAEARAFDKLQLASATTYPNAAIIAKEAEIREELARVCGVDFIPTTHTDEYLSGDGSDELMLAWPLVTSVTAASIRSDSTWTALTVDELANVQIDPEATDTLYREGSYWPRGTRNVKVTYVAGHSTVPALIKRAALLIAVTELPTSNVPFSAESYEGGGMNVSYAEGDGYQGNWSRIAEVRKAMRLCTRRLPGIS